MPPGIRILGSKQHNLLLTRSSTLHPRPYKYCYRCVHLHPAHAHGVERATPETPAYWPPHHLRCWISVSPFPSLHPIPFCIRREHRVAIDKTTSVCVAGALRLYYSIITDKSPDTPWEGFYLWTWESIEINLGIVCASAPCLKSMISRLVPKFFSSQASSSDFRSLEMESRLRGQRVTGGGAKRDVGRGFVMTTITAGKGMDGGESQDDLTEGRGYGVERVMVAKGGVHDMA